MMTEITINHFSNTVKFLIVKNLLKRNLLLSLNNINSACLMWHVLDAHALLQACFLFSALRELAALKGLVSSSLHRSCAPHCPVSTT